jgi:peroxiredoxin
MSLDQLPENLPVPVDDGACAHLTGIKLPKIKLACTNDRSINIGTLTGYSVIYVYPMTGRPNVALPEGWESIPGARGCTPQSCGFRDLHNEIKQYANLYGLSSQDTDYQQEAKSRLHLPFELLSDHSFLLKQALSLPTFTVEGIQRYKRVTLILKDAVIEKVFYPVFPPDENADNVLNWLDTMNN